ncbi:glucuronate isomerase [Natranaerovirga hydrolytica]|uniref:Uronate isomerase n=1 Tax=Natranaerovirga hydrolytica TaxID=680378 RepID=A0A4R1MU33_9FIRM|nr:glucuronate isomerase [Natranaerovirga hydrolytica]TCK93493.1 glucuronate isomerase [Natranaerovirga hydrolytica]
MKKFMDDDFLLKNDVAIELYHKYAKEMPIYDYHCHLSPEEISTNKQYKNITELWLDGDHYKWRAMRSNGIDEKYITGDADDYDKFLAWAQTVDMSIGNPLYHWTHLELKRYFGIDEILSEKTAKAIWEKCNTLLEKDAYRAKSLIKNSNVNFICTTDDPTDDLEFHKDIKADKEFKTKVLPTFRPDKGLNIDKEDFSMWVQKLSESTKTKIHNYEDYLNALDSRIAYFNQVGCKISDHSLEEVIYLYGTKEEVNDIFIKGIEGKKLTIEEVKKYKTFTLNYLGKKYYDYGWVMQLHIGALRNNNTKMYEFLGGDIGFDSINDQNIAQPLSNILNALEYHKKLPKTILYCLNPKDNYILGTMIGNFQGEGIPGKIQFGSGWWFNDQKEGMIQQMTALANLGLLSRFVGMLTDSRSFTSYTRHEYFRRILCNLVGQWVEDGEVPCNMDYLGKMIQNICYNNAVGYFDLK